MKSETTVFRFARRGAVALVAAAVTLAGGSLVPPLAAAEPGLPGVSIPAPPADSFYDRPADLASLKPGDIVRTRATTVRTLQVLPVNVDAWQIAYRTTGMNSEPDMTVTTVMVPRGSKPTKLLSYQAASDSTLRICQPSYTLTQGGPIDLASPAGPLVASSAAAEILFGSLGVNEGWAVAMPDHGGGDNRFLTPRQPGWAVLDGIRAVQNFERMGMNRSTPVALWGFSGGAIASSWTAEEQPTYAPELTIRGIAMGASVRDLGASVRSANGTLLGGLIPLALSAIGKDSEKFRTALNSYLTPQGRARVEETRRHCMPQNVVANLWFDYRQNLTKPIDQVLAVPAIAKAVAERGVSGRVPTVPVYVYNGVGEEVAPISGVDALVNSYCSGGAAVTYRREQIPPLVLPQVMTTHGTMAITGAPGAFDWLRDRMKGIPAATGCDTKTVLSTALEPRAISTFGQALGPLIASMANVPIGSGRR